MKIAYIVLAHKLPEQLIRLVRKLNTPGSVFFIHVDKKAHAEIYKRMTESLASCENVHFLERHAIYYGDYSHVRATLAGIRKLLVFQIPFDYVILITGQDYPIKSNEQIETCLRDSGQKSYMEYFSLPDGDNWKDDNGGQDRINYWYLHWRGWELPLMKRIQSWVSIPDRTWSFLSKVLPLQRCLPGKFKGYGGSAYWCLSRDCTEYVDEFTRRNRSFVKFFEHVGIPGEIFFQTILLNSPLRDRVVNDNLRYIVWSNSRHPATLGKPDFDLFMDTHNLFARKFDITKDEKVLDMIDQATT